MFTFKPYHSEWLVDRYLSVVSGHVTFFKGVSKGFDSNATKVIFYMSISQKWGINKDPPLEMPEH